MQIKIILFIAALVLSISILYNKKENPKEKENNNSSVAGQPLINSDPILNLAGRNVASNKNGPKRRKNAVLVKLKANVSAEQIENLRRVYDEYDLQNEKRLLGGKVIRLKIKKRADEDQEINVARALIETGAAEIAEPDYLIPLAFIPNDSLFSSQWHHATIQSPLAWDITAGIDTVLVAVCDAGFNLSHPDLAAQFVLPGYNTVKNNSDIDSINDHGTATSGILAAIGNNSMGVTGVAWKVRILPIQITDRADGVSSYSDIAECISYASSRGAKVVNISYDSNYTSAVVSDAALAMRNAGGLVVVAGGNSTMDISPWGTSTNLIVVGASDSQDKLSWFSNYGTPIDLYAPGQDLYSTTGAGEYNLVSGTSFATPVVAGTVALIYSVNPAFSSAQVETFLLGNLKYVGLPGGRIDAGAAVTKAKQSIQVQNEPIILDNLSWGKSDQWHSFVGKWCTSSTPGSYGELALISCGSRTDSYRFTPGIPKAGLHGVYIRYISQSYVSTRATVKIRSTTGTISKEVNMRSGGETWYFLGNYNLAIGLVNYVEVSDTGGSVIIDGAKFQLLP